jgi:MFS family permease
MIVFGLGIGVMHLMQNYLWAEYFGRQHIGSIRGAVMPITLLFGSAGAPIAGYVQDFTGSYNPMWILSTGLMALGALVLAWTPPPRARAQADPPARAAAKLVIGGSPTVVAEGAAPPPRSAIDRDR